MSQIDGALRAWVLMAFRALDEAAGVLDTLQPEDMEESMRLSTLAFRIEDLAHRVPLLLGMSYAQTQRSAEAAVEVAGAQPG
jgi:hypothetical protein